jgi:CRP-like cAMP-binding protein
MDSLSCKDCFTNTNSTFRHLNPDEINILSDNRDIRTFKKGHIIYQEGMKLRGAYCIQKGIIKVYKTGIEGKEQIIKFAKSGDIIGFRSVLSEELACTSAQVLEEGVLCFISADVLISLIKGNPDFSLDIIKLACKELDEANEYLTDVAQKSVRERLAEVLLKLHDGFSNDSEGFIQITLTREDLANMVGTATESVIRLLSEFKNDGYVSLQGRKIKINDYNALNRLTNM